MANNLKIKVCGMRDPANISAVAKLRPDYMGFIFYERSPRYAASLAPSALPQEVRRVGVFVNAPTTEIAGTAERYGLHAVQLHGSESPESCRRLREMGYEVIKAFGIETAADFAQTAGYAACCDLFLFDTRTPKHGGSGDRFDWRLLDGYTGHVPFLLSGGIAPTDTDAISILNHPMLYGIDLNSRFEIEAGLKNTELLEHFIQTIRS
ncbi:phosphoribosylanthranilate isomerase [uncultured Rikenella sp.]|uniref:phosphoribosylanthranilate isomerase n=1 Tax=uncultured Rikenella sp. TaxID=368003 RepID=UPI0026324537|nr:phosphoribosylanthranilate isomerase [uncultured Rikenella sp.]